MGNSLTGRKLGKGIYQRKDGLYSARYTSIRGKRIEQYFRNPQEAKRWLESEKLKDVRQVSNVNPRMTVDEWYNYWIKNVKEPVVRYNTVRNYRDRYHFNVKPVIGKMRMTDVRPVHCQMVLNEMVDDYKGSTIEQTRIMMCSMFYYAMINEVIARTPTNKMVKLPKTVEKKIRFLDVSEQQRFLEEAKSRSTFDQFMLVLQTGIRTGELVGLKWEDIDLKGRIITIQRTMEYRRQEKCFHEGPPKSKHGYRRIPMTNTAYEILKRKECEREYRPVEKKEFNDFVFLNRKGSPTKNSAYDTALYKICKDAGIKPISMHSLRHTFATRCIEAGMKPKILQEILGHAHLSTTMDLYVHNTDEEKVKEIGIFENNFDELFPVI